SGIDKSLVEAGDCATVHFFVLAVAAVHFDDSRLIAVALGIQGRAAKRLGPVSRQPLHVLGVKAMTEGMTDHRILHHAMMPGAGKTAQAVAAARCFEDTTHRSMIAMPPRRCKSMDTNFGTRLLCPHPHARFRTRHSPFFARERPLAGVRFPAH